MKKLILKLIDNYQKKGGGEEQLFVTCNLRPTCSEFGKYAIKRYGIVKGMRLLIKRMKKCTKMNNY
ncbi:MAG: membrane protein insertion efficiency factor YidD [Bacteroidales bacterium]|nr:membrane protein insertion efficiency factor YidD [Bacteroidales bacterium]MCF8336410.1 membrane protein insertion efficiency factor YidD [Bacteroidales bacterium]